MNPITAWLAASLAFISALAFIGALSTHLQIKRNDEPSRADALSQWRARDSKDRETRDNALVAAVILALLALVLLIVAAVYR